MMLSGLQGFGVGLGLIVAIGAQNAFVLRQGLRREHAWRVASLCVLCDATLIIAGIGGLAPLLRSSALALELARWGGAAWLLWQAGASLRRALRPGSLDVESGQRSAGSVAVATLAVTLLNPHVYLDTVVMLGAIGAQQPDRWAFAAGAVLASILWFYALVAAAGWLAPRLRDPRWWRGIDVLVAGVLTLVALRLILMPL
ncbi:LysE/ArgO family amino acid transporter [Salinicola halophilus]|uniref:LysE/ArgO family amino acid transporter n=1 Tax=Salinicola halophilus TaxID=184065 RepID=UPI0019550837|nr:LysE/ArgO family amino acid transporter [Salinicola halophilus]